MNILDTAPPEAQPLHEHHTRPTGNRSHVDVDAEWTQVARSRRNTTALTDWAQTSPTLRRHQNLDEVVTAMRHLDRQESNAYWRELLAIAKNGDPLARRVLLQVVVPALEAEITRWYRVFSNQSPGTTRVEIEQLVYAAAIHALRQLERRDRVTWPVLDILRATRRIVTSSIRSDERWAQTTVSIDETESLELPAAPTEDHPSDSLRQALRELVDTGHVSAENASLVWHTRSGHRTFDDLAAEYGTSPDTLRRRRHRTEKALHGALAHAA